MIELVRVVVPRLLVGSDPRMEVLRCQWAAADVSISYPSPCGFFADIVVPSELPRVGDLNRGAGNALIPIEGVERKHQTTSCILYVEGGALSYLEVYNAVDWERAPVFGLPLWIEPFSLEKPAAAAGHDG